MSKWAIAWVVTLVACGPTLGTRGLVTARARLDMPCEDPSRVLQLADHVFEVDGCGLEAEYETVGVDEPEDFLRITPAATIAAADTRCPLEQLESVGEREPTRRTFGGCGATATYELSCVEGMACHWARLGEVARIDSDVPLIVPAPPGAP